MGALFNDLNEVLTPYAEKINGLRNDTDLTMENITAIDEKFSGYHTLSYDKRNAIPPESDLDEFITPGNYKITSAANAQAIDNCPSDKSGSLEVSTMATANMTRQIYTSYENGDDGLYIVMYVRYKGSAAQWGKWSRFLLGSDLHQINTRFDDFELFVSTYLKGVYDEKTFDFSTIATETYPTGWRNGYINSTGSSSSSNLYIRTMLIPHTAFDPNDEYMLVEAPEDCCAWVSEFNNDYVSESNYVNIYGALSSDHWVQTPILVPISGKTGFVITIGKFEAGTISERLTPEFISSIRCEIYSSRNVKSYKNKKLSLLGDSMSAYSGEIPVGNKSYYSGNNAGVSDPKQMWFNVLCDDLKMEKLVIDAWSGSCVASGIRNDSTYVPASSPSRCENIHIGQTMPDVILVAVGTNDYTYSETSDQFGDWDGSTPLGSESDMSDYINTDFTRGYATLIARLRKTYPNAEIFCLTPWFCCRRQVDTGVTYLNGIGKKLSDYGDRIRKIADMMGVKVIDVTNIGFNRHNYYPTYAEDSSTTPTHANAAGQAYIGHAVARALMKM